jgi:hypothetical protein
MAEHEGDDNRVVELPSDGNAIGWCVRSNGTGLIKPQHEFLDFAPPAALTASHKFSQIPADG